MTTIPEAGGPAPILLERTGHVAVMRLNDPERRNGLSPEVISALVDMVSRVNQDRTIRALVLTGNGTAFSAGGSPKRMIAPGSFPDMSPVEIRDAFRYGIQRIAEAFAALETPVVAAVNGPAIGAGCDLACMCDIRVASEQATFASSFVKLGLVPGDGGAWFLPRVVGQARAAEMLLTGRPVAADEALAMGLVSAVVPAGRLEEEALQRANAVAANPPQATRLAKRLLRDSADVPLSVALELAAAMQGLALKAEDQREAVLAMLDKRAPDFKGK